MAMKISKKMKGGGGFMCHSNAATAVCTVNDPRSIILPTHRTTANTNVHKSRLKMITPQYTRLVESPLHNPNAANNSNLSSFDKKQVRKMQLNNDNNNRGANVIPLQKPSSLLAASASTEQVFQVVVMRVSLHCQGCAGKLKKHLSKMEGVTSFSIDLETQRVTVMGHVSPVVVLESISKVKRAEFWPCS